MIKLNIKYISNNFHLIVPMIVSFLWALFHLIHEKFIPSDTCDFAVFYNAGKLLYTDPLELYALEHRYFHMPFFATFCSITVSLLPYFYAYYVYYIANIILFFILILEFNKILTLKGLKRKSHRFFFLIIISNGFIVHGIFYQNSFKFLIGVIILFIISREILLRQKNIEKDIKYLIINYGLFAFVIALFPPFFFFLLIYVFYDIPFKKIFKIENIKKYLIVIFWIFAQNFLFFIYPSYLFSFLNSFQGHNTFERGYFPLFYLREWVVLSNYELVFYISTIYMAIIALIIIFNKDLLIEEKFAYYSFAWIIFSTYAGRSLFILFPLALLLYIPFIQQKNNFFEFLKKNLIIILGLISVAFLYLTPPDFTIFKYFPFLQEVPWVLIIYLRKLVMLIIFSGTVAYLYLKRYLKNDSINQNS